MTNLLIQNFNSQEFRQFLQEVIAEEFLKLKDSLPKTNSPPFDLTSDHLLSQQEAAKLMRVSIPTFRKMVQERKIKAIRVGKRHRFKPNDLIK